jgi:uncharacterized membrane protein
MTITPSRRALPPFLTARGRLLAAVLLGVGFYGFATLPGLAENLGLPLRIALSWDVVTIVYLLLAFVMMRNPDRARIRWRAKVIDIRLPEIVGVAMLAGLFSLFAVAIVLAKAGNLPADEKIAHLIIGVITVVLSWVALHTIFAVHYAHIFYDPAEHPQKVRGGLEFPDENEPDYWDFVYFSIVIGMTCQVSDVQVTGRVMRHLVTVQGVIAFFYNTVILALAVNFGANMGLGAGG